MEAAAPAASRCTLLALEPSGILEQRIIPALPLDARRQLALACSTTRRLVQRGTTCLSLIEDLAHASHAPLHLRFPHVDHIGTCVGDSSDLLAFG